MKHLFESDPFSIHRGGGAIPIAQAMAGQRLLRLRLPLPRAPENVTVCEEPLTDTPMRHATSRSLRSRLLNGSSKRNRPTEKISRRSQWNLKKAGLTDYEAAGLACAASAAGGVEDTVSNWLLREEMEKAGFNRLACNVSV